MGRFLEKAIVSNWALFAGPYLLTMLLFVV